MVIYLLKISLSLLVFLICFWAFFRRDKWFKFNRYYLIGALIISILSPFIQWHIDLENAPMFAQQMEVIAQESTHELALDEATTQSPQEEEASNYSWLPPFLSVLYVLGAFILLLRLIKNVRHIIKEINASEISWFQGAKLALTSHEVDPYSFMRYIIVNKEAYDKGKIDKDIMNHELSHCHQLHTIDILIVELLTIALWWNPLIWIYKVAIKTNHEYLADKSVVKNDVDVQLYAHKIIQAQAPVLNHLPVNFFNFSQTKNRITMLTQNNKSSLFSFTSKAIGAVLIVGITIALLSFSESDSTRSTRGESKEFVVIIDPGHGEADPGSKFDDISEKEIVLQIAKKVADKANGENIKIILTRDRDNFVSLKDRVGMTKKHKADLFLSIHVNASKDEEKNGVEIYFSNEGVNHKLAERYGEILAKRVSLRDEVDGISLRSDNLYVLREAACPSVMIELGFLTNKDDRKYLSSHEHIDRISTDIIKALNSMSKL